MEIASEYQAVTSSGYVISRRDSEPSAKAAANRYADLITSQWRRGIITQDEYESLFPIHVQERTHTITPWTTVWTHTHE